MNTTACMGGWCLMREECRLYRHPAPTLVSERLCEPNKLNSFEPVRIVRAPGTWERKHIDQLAPARWTDPVH